MELPYIHVMNVQEDYVGNYTFIHVLIYYHYSFMMIPCLLTCGRFYDVNKLVKPVLVMINKQHQLLCVLNEQY